MPIKMPINSTANSVTDIVNLIRQINLQPNDASEHTITLSGSFPATAQVTSAATGADANLFGALAFPVILRNTRIIGNGKTISGQSAQFRFFGINGKRPDATYAKLTLENLGLSNGNSGTQGGGAILNDGTSSAPGSKSLVIRNCYIYLNSGGTNGGAIYNGDGAKCVTSESIFSNNTAVSSNTRGGAIYNSSGSTLIIRDSTFTSNIALGTGSLGGAIFMFSGQVDIKNSSFVGNTAAGNGTPSMTVYRQSGTLDASWNWWGAPVVAGAPQPARTSIPRFTRPQSYPAFNPASPAPYYNPSLPPETTCQITAWNGAILRRGPSDDDTQISPPAGYPNLPLKTRAQATDGLAMFG